VSYFENLIKIREYLQNEIEFLEKCETPMDMKHLDYGYGILISGNEAKELVRFIDITLNKLKRCPLLKDEGDE